MLRRLFRHLLKLQDTVNGERSAFEVQTIGTIGLILPNILHNGPFILEKSAKSVKITLECCHFLIWGVSDVRKVIWY